MSQQEQSVQYPKPTDANCDASDPVADDLANGEAAAANNFPAHGAASPATNPAPQRSGTPMQNENGPDIVSRAASQHADPDVPSHGALTRQYLNSKVTPVLLEAMKLLAKEQPRDPLRVLGEFLIQRSQDLED